MSATTHSSGACTVKIVPSTKEVRFKFCDWATMFYVIFLNIFLELIRSHLLARHPHNFALCCTTRVESNKHSDGRRAGSSFSSTIEIIDVDDAPKNSMTIHDLVNLKEDKEIKVKVFKGNLEDLKTKSGSEAPPMLITNVEANVTM